MFNSLAFNAAFIWDSFLKFSSSNLFTFLKSVSYLVAWASMSSSSIISFFKSSMQASWSYTFTFTSSNSILDNLNYSSKSSFSSNNPSYFFISSSKRCYNSSLWALAVSSWAINSFVYWFLFLLIYAIILFVSISTLAASSFFKLSFFRSPSFLAISKLSFYYVKKSNSFSND